MEKLTFDQMPNTVGEIAADVSELKRLFLAFINQSKPEADQILTVQEAANYLNLAVPTVYSLVSRKEVPFFKKSKRLYFSKEALTNYILSGKKKTVSEIEEEAVSRMASKSKGDKIYA